MGIPSIRRRLRHLFAVLVLSLCFPLNACAQMGDTYGGRSGGNAFEASPPQLVYEFPDLPLPAELERVDDKTMIVRTPAFQGGVLVMQGRVTVDSLVDFFTKTFPRYGWVLNGTLRTDRHLLAFTKERGATCLIQIFETKMGLQTEAQLWITQPMGL